MIVMWCHDGCMDPGIPGLIAHRGVSACSVLRFCGEEGLRLVLLVHTSATVVFTASL